MSGPRAPSPPAPPAGGSGGRRVRLGTIATAHGVRGDVKIICHAQDPDLLNGTLFTAEAGDGTLAVAMKAPMGKYWLAAIEGVTDRDAALALRGTALWAARESLPATGGEDEFYIEDLTGLRALRPDGAEEGSVAGVHNYGAGDLLEIRPLAGESYFLPFTKACVPDVRIAEGFITVVRPAEV